MANIDILREEITTDPLGRAYSAMADSQVADSLNLPDRPGKKAVPATDVRLYVLLNGLFPGIQNLAASGQDPTQRGTAVTILQTMVDAGAMTAQHRTDMLALGDTLISRAQELGLPTVHHLDVAEARNG